MGYKVYQYKNKKNIGMDLNILFYSEEIVRFYYGNEEINNLSNAVILKPRTIQTFETEGFISSKNFDIVIREDLLVTIVDKKGNKIIEDFEINFDKKENTLGNVTVLDDIDSTLDGTIFEKNYAVEHKKNFLWETGFYGLGEKYGFINLIDRFTENWNTDVIGFTPTHQAAHNAYHTSIPFYIGMNVHNSYGIFYDTSYRNSFDFKKYSPSITFKSHGGTLDYYFIFGKKVSDIVENYSKLTGTLKLPRKDFLGYQQCRWTYNSVEEVLELANNMRTNQIPCDVIYLDIDYMQNFKVFTIHSERFKDFKAMTSQLHSMGFKLVVVIDPGVKKEKGYKVYEEGIKKDYFVKDENGEVYIGKVWPGDSAFPNFLRKKVRAWWGELHRSFIENGVDGIWNDMNEVSDMSTSSKTIPENTEHIDDNKKTIYHKEFHNLYGHYHTMATYEGLKKIQGIRPFVLTRAASAGTQRNSALWTGDNSSLWEHLEASIPMNLNLGLSGYSYVGSDIGGFLDDCSKELFIRWIQLGIFYPLCRNHSVINSLHQEPWSFDEETLNISKKYIELRYSLIDYLYNLFRESSIRGTPIMRPLFYHYQDDIETHNINDQFLFGKDIMIAPIIRPKTENRLVYFPKGTWINYFTGNVTEGGNYSIQKASLSELLLFVKEGTILLKNKKMQYIGDNCLNKEIHVYFGKNNEETFYFDDGISFEYEKGIYSELLIRVENHIITIKKQENNYNIGDLDLFIFMKNRSIEVKNIKFNKNNFFRYEII